MTIDPKMLADCKRLVEVRESWAKDPDNATWMNEYDEIRRRMTLGFALYHVARTLVEAAAEIERLKRDGQEAITEAERAELSRRREQGDG